MSANSFSLNIEQFCNLNSFEVDLEKSNLDTYRIVYSIPSQCSDFSVASNFPVAYFSPEKKKLLIISPIDSSRSESGIFFIQTDSKNIDIDQQILGSVKF